MKSKRILQIVFSIGLLVSLLVVSATSVFSRTEVMPNLVVQFSGRGRANNYDLDTVVPDTTGAAGHLHYLQAVNEQLALYRKDGRFPGENPESPPSGTPLFSADFETLWTGANTGTSCDGGNGYHHGQPSIVYDHMAGRWVVVDVAYSDGNTGPYYLCVAVSKGIALPSTPGGSAFFSKDHWYYYTVDTNVGIYRYYPDSPKLGLWPDGYYLAADLYDAYNSGLNRTPKGLKVWALNREDLLGGVQEEARFVTYYLNEQMGFEHLVPTTLLGTPPQYGTPNYFASIEPGRMSFWKFQVDWINTNVSTFGDALHRPDFILPTDTSIIWANGYLIPQPGTGERLEVHGDKLTSPLQYRIINGVASLWTMHTILSGGVTGLRWYEFRPDPAGAIAPTIYQQGTHQPDTHYRWLGSLAVDRAGDMAMGFNISSLTLYPSIFYAGRLVTDPLSNLTQGEAPFYYGSGHENDGDPIIDGQWGRQSTMSIDPMNECIFWYTNAYYEAASASQWKTRIGWFTFPSCKGGSNARISVSTANVEGDQASGVEFEAYSTGVSYDGRFVVFTSEATNLAAGDTNGRRDVFLRDRDTDLDGVFDEPGAVSTERITDFGYDGLQPLGHSWQVAISGDGRYIAFSSEASNLVPGDTNGLRDVFVYDRVTQAFIRASVADSTALQANAVSDQPTLSYDGRYLAFRSWASNLTGDARNVGSNVYLRDLLAGRTYLVSKPVSAPVTQNAFSPSISADGRYVAFTALVNNLITNDTNNAEDVFLYSRIMVNNVITESISRLSVSSNGAEGNYHSHNPRISGNGRFVVFASDANTLVPGDTNGYTDIFVRDLLTNKTDRVSLNFLGLQANNGDSYTPDVSFDGTYIVFASDASNMDSTMPDLNARRDVFLHDRTAVLAGAYEIGLTSRVSQDYLGGEPNDWSLAPTISGNGRHVVFLSEATDIVPNDTNYVWDVFVNDTQRTVPVFLSADPEQAVELGSNINVPINFSTNGFAIDTIVFSVDYDAACLSFNPVDGLQFTLPAGFTASFNHNPNDADGEIDVVIMDTTAPVQALPGGTLLNLTFQVSSSCPVVAGSSANMRVGFSGSPSASFASKGVTVVGGVSDGFVRIVGGTLGDCNRDTAVNAGDLTGMVLEIFDGDPGDPGSVAGGSYSGDSIGCNPNQDYLVDAGDLSSTVGIIFGGSVQADKDELPVPTDKNSLGVPMISLPMSLTEPEKPVSVPVNFTANGSAISSLVFSLDYDSSLATLDPADADQNGIPDAVQFDLPTGFQVAVKYDPADLNGELDVVVWSMAWPQLALPDGPFMSITLQPLAQSATTPLTFTADPRLSFGNTSGQSVYGLHQNGSLVIGAVQKVFIPFVNRR